MDTSAHHLTPVYVLVVSIVVPLLIIGVWRYLAKRQHRKAEEAMRRGNQLHRKWLEASKLMDEHSAGQ